MELWRVGLASACWISAAVETESYAATERQPNVGKFDQQGAMALFKLLKR